LETLYLYDIGISSGCIPLRFSKDKNVEMLLDVMTANQANGRRKTIRMFCSSNDSLNILDEKADKLLGKLLDISISHFSCHFPEQDPQFPLGKTIPQIQLFLGGTRLMVDAAVSMKRVVQDKVIYVFLFRFAKGQSGLEDAMKLKVNKIIFNRYQQTMKALIEEKVHSRQSVPPKKAIDLQSSLKSVKPLASPHASDLP
jgi:hypothetical protein